MPKTRRFFSRFPHLPSIIVLLLSGPFYFVAYQANPSQHFGIGRWDSAFLAEEADFYPPIRMSGPFRHSDNTVEIREFVGRLTRRRASFQIPYHALRTPLQFSLRCHRFGLQGSVNLTVNGSPIREFVFTKQSYPWGGIRAVIPQEVAERGPLRVELLTVGGDAPPGHLPEDLGLGVDWLEVSPISRGVLLLPTAPQWFRLFLFLLLGFFFLRFLDIEPLATALAMLTLALGVSAMASFYPVTTSQTLVFAWLFFPVVMLLIWIAELADRRSSSLATGEPV